MPAMSLADYWTLSGRCGSCEQRPDGYRLGGSVGSSIGAAACWVIQPLEQTSRHGQPPLLGRDELSPGGPDIVASADVTPLALPAHF
jgi:hypothetical protein